MRQCHFCKRWFRNRQATRRHLGYCRLYLESDRPATKWTRVRLMQCERCVQQLGHQGAQKVTTDELHSQYVHGCPVCGHTLWQPAGWKRVPVEQPTA